MQILPTFDKAVPEGGATSFKELRRPALQGPKLGGAFRLGPSCTSVTQLTVASHQSQENGRHLSSIEAITHITLDCTNFKTLYLFSALLSQNEDPIVGGHTCTTWTAAAIDSCTARSNFIPVPAPCVVAGNAPTPYPKAAAY